MQERAIVYFVVGYLGCWLMDLTTVVARGPFLPDPAIKLVIILLCLAVILTALWRQRWLLP